jgi:uncharacterized protein Yka (UPF0111/DUF47 family)
MNFLQRIFSGDGKFYDLLEASSRTAKEGASQLTSMLSLHGTDEFEGAVANLALIRRKHKRTTQEITEQLCKNFVTPLEREDIEALSSALYRITKNVEKIGERLSICQRLISADKFARQVKMTEQAAESVCQMVGELRSKPHLEQITDTYERLQSVEGEADKLMLELLRDLYQGSIEAKEVIILKDLYELIEKVVDRCRDAGNVVFQVVLKYS